MAGVAEAVRNFIRRTSLGLPESGALQSIIPCSLRNVSARMASCQRLDLYLNPASLEVPALDLHGSTQKVWTPPSRAGEALQDQLLPGDGIYWKTRAVRSRS